MTIILNLYGGPGTGKSTTAADLFARIKRFGVNAELVSEYVKQWAWEKRKPVNYDQFYFFGKQSRKEYSLFGQVEAVVSDSPASMISYYASIYGTLEQARLFVDMSKVYYDMCTNEGHVHKHIFLNRVKAYNPAGRFQSETDARRIDAELRSYLTTTLGFDITDVDADELAAEKICSIIGWK